MFSPHKFPRFKLHKGAFVPLPKLPLPIPAPHAHKLPIGDELRCLGTQYILPPHIISQLSNYYLRRYGKEEFFKNHPAYFPIYRDECIYIPVYFHTTVHKISISPCKDVLVSFRKHPSQPFGYALIQEYYTNPEDRHSQAAAAAAKSTEKDSK